MPTSQSRRSKTLSAISFRQGSLCPALPRKNCKMKTAPAIRKPRTRIVVPSASRPRRFYGHGIPGVELNKLRGKLIVVEGSDGSGRSTQIARLVEWLEVSGHATVQVGLSRSSLVSE